MDGIPDRAAVTDDQGDKTYVNGVGFDAVYENYYETQAVMLSLERKL